MTDTQNPPPSGDALTPREAAWMLGCSATRLSAMVSDGCLTQYQDAAAVLFDRTEVLALLDGLSVKKEVVAPRRRQPPEWILQERLDAESDRERAELEAENAELRSRLAAMESDEWDDEDDEGEWDDEDEDDVAMRRDIAAGWRPGHPVPSPSSSVDDDRAPIAASYANRGPSGGANTKAWSGGAVFVAIVIAVWLYVWLTPEQPRSTFWDDAPADYSPDYYDPNAP